MPVEEDVQSADDLNPLWPLGSDPIGQGDDHIRIIKQLLKDGQLGSISEVITLILKNAAEELLNSRVTGAQAVVESWAKVIG